MCREVLGKQLPCKQLPFQWGRGKINIFNLGVLENVNQVAALRKWILQFPRQGRSHEGTQSPQFWENTGQGSTENSKSYPNPSGLAIMWLERVSGGEKGTQRIPKFIRILLPQPSQSWRGCQEGMGSIGNSKTYPNPSCTALAWS